MAALRAAERGVREDRGLRGVGRNERASRAHVQGKALWWPFMIVPLTTAVPVVVFVVGVMIVGVSKHHYPTNFFAINAQVIPVLLLALAIEIRAFELPPGKVELRPVKSISELRKRAEDPKQQWLQSRIQLLPILAALAAGEMACLRHIAYPDSGRWGQGIVVGAVAAGLTMICMAAIFGSKPETRHQGTDGLSR